MNRGDNDHDGDDRVYNNTYIGIILLYCIL